MNSTSEFDETQRAWATWILSALCLLWFVLAGRIALAGRWDNLRWFLLMGDPHAQDTLGALSAAAIEDGEWWRLITTLFVHQDFFHLLINLSTFFGYGRRLERLWGSWR
ncbi:MAG: rhomboid family intramembrane serine protease, partial [Gemmataceae bacterium]|nr:rhomboid family intramembrane serine protease [Gemmataceae bacterium]